MDDSSVLASLAAGYISGTVTDAGTGLPLANVRVSVYSSSGSYLTYGYTNGLGVYTSTLGLSTGTYYARTYNFAGYLEEVYNNLSCPQGVCTITSGTPISVTDGSTTTGIDFALAPGGRIGGTVTDTPTGLPLGNVGIDIYNSGGSYVTNGYADTSGAYTSYSGLPSGTYYARTWNSLAYIDELYNNISCAGGSCTVTGGTPITVTVGATTTGIDFGLAPGGRISGTVTDAGTSLPVANVQVRIYNSSGSQLTSSNTNSSGFYTTSTGLLSGTYYARTSNSLGYIDELYNNIPCPGSCTVTSGTPISVTTGTTTTGIDFGLAQGGRITGTVTDAGTGLPLANVSVQIYNSCNSFVTSASTNSSGVYTTGGLLSGTFYALTSNSLGYVDELYNNTPCPGGSCTVSSGTPISVTVGATTAGIDFGLAPGGRISGTVTDAGTSLPLANVTVDLYSASGSWAGYGNTNSVGAFVSYNGLPSGSYYARTWNSLGYVDELYNNIPCPGGCSVTGGTPISVTPGTTTTGIDFALIQGGRISGTVTDEATGLPLPSVPVRIYGSSGSQVTSVSTNSSGVYTSSAGLPSGMYYARTSNSLGYIDELYNDISCPNGACTATSGTPITVTAGATSGGIDFALAPGGRISGTATDASSGLPLGSISVGIYSSSGTNLTSGFTNASGVYTSSGGLPTGTYYARTSNSLGYLDELYDNISCPGGTCTASSGTPIDVTVGATTNGINFALASGGRISGMVTDAATGLPLLSVQVRIYNSAGTQVASSNTSCSGAYITGSGLPSGTYYARTSNSLGYIDELYNNISCPGGSCSPTSGTPITVTQGTTTAGIDFGLALGGRISGTVTDAGTGLPLANVEVDLYNSSGSYVTYGYANSSGVYTSNSGLLSGTYYARTWNSLGYIEELYSNISCPGGPCTVTTGTPISVTQGVTTTGIDFGLAAGGRFSGTVTDASTGLPLASVRVSVYNSSGSYVTYAYSNSSGVYTTSSGLLSGTYYARTSNSLGYIDELFNNISCPGGSCSASSGTPISVTAGTTTTGIDFGLAPGGRISGTVTDAATGLPLANVGIDVYSASGGYVTYGNTNGSGVYTSSSGLPSGTYYAVTDNSSGYVDELYNNISCPGGSCPVTGGTPISVTAGTTTTGVDFGLAPGGRVSGTVTDAGTGVPLANVGIDVYSASGGYVTYAYSNSSGVYTTSSGLLSGTYYAVTYNSSGYVDELYNNILCAGYACTVTSGTPISVTAGATTPGIDFGLAAGGRISGTLTDAATGLPLANVNVGIYSSGGSYLTNGSANSSGMYTSRSGLPSGTYYAVTYNSQGYVDELYNNVACPGYACALGGGTPIAVSLGTTTGGIDFALSPGGRVSGMVTDASTGLPLASMYVEIHNAGGTYVGYGYTDILGSYTSRTGLPTGTYYAKTRNWQGYVDELYDNLPCSGYGCTVTSGAPFSVTAGATTGGISFALGAGGRIAGQVTDVASGTPLGGVAVHVLNAAGDQLASASTGSDGRYSVGPGLPTGSYYLLTTNSAGYLDELHNDVACPSYLMLREGVGLSGRRVPVPSCAVSSGVAVAVTVGSTTSVDFGLALGGRVSGSVTGVGVGSIPGIKIDVFGAAGQWLGAGETDGVGFYQTPAVPAGSYFLRTSNRSGWIDELFDNIPCPGGSCSVTSGTPVAVSVGNTAGGISFVLRADVIFADGFE